MDLNQYVNKIGPVPELPQARGMFNQLVIGYQYVNSQNIVHRDIKPANILVKYEGSRRVCLKWADFGFSKILTPENSIGSQTSIRSG